LNEKGKGERVRGKPEQRKKGTEKRPQYKKMLTTTHGGPARQQKFWGGNRTQKKRGG